MRHSIHSRIQFKTKLIYILSSAGNFSPVSFAIPFFSLTNFVGLFSFQLLTFVCRTPNKIPPLQRAQLCEGGTWYHWQPAAVRRKELRLGPWLCETGFRRWCFCLYRYPSAGVMHRFRWSLSAGKAACGKHTESFCTAGQNAANQHFQYTIIIRKRQVNNVN